MTATKQALPFVPTEFHVSTVEDDQGALGILSISTTSGRLNVALDSEAAVALVKAVAKLQAKLHQKSKFGG